MRVCTVAWPGLAVLVPALDASCVVFRLPRFLIFGRAWNAVVGLVAAASCNLLSHKLAINHIENLLITIEHPVFPDQLKAEGRRFKGLIVGCHDGYLQAAIFPEVRA